MSIDIVPVGTAHGVGDNFRKREVGLRASVLGLGFAFGLIVGLRAS